MRISDWSSDVCASDLNGVFISTYPVELFSSITEESNGCGALRGIVYDEARFLESIGQNLNSAIRSESVLGSENLDYRRFYSVGGIARSFLGHGYCADATFFTAWHDGSNMMLHPKKYGNEAIRDRYLEESGRAEEHSSELQSLMRITY